MALLAKQVREVAGRDVEAVGNGVAADGAVKVLLDIDADAVKQLSPSRPLEGGLRQQLTGAGEQRLQQVVVGGERPGSSTSTLRAASMCSFT